MKKSVLLSLVVALFIQIQAGAQSTTTTVAKPRFTATVYTEHFTDPRDQLAISSK